MQPVGIKRLKAPCKQYLPNCILIMGKAQRIHRRIEIIGNISDRLLNRKVINPGNDLLKEELKHKIFIGTHHKTGTVWLNKIFSEISKPFGLEMFNGIQSDLPINYNIFFQDHSNFSQSLSKMGQG